MKSFIIMLQFLTRIPIQVSLTCDESDFRRGIYYFSTIGAIIGLILLGVYSFISRLGIDTSSVAILLIIAHVLITGGLHLDGVGDSADGLFSNRPPERMLEIMKDSRIGSNGVIAIIMVFALKFVGYHFVLSHGFLIDVMAMPIVARFCVVIVAKFGKAVRKNGMGNLFIGQTNYLHLAINALPIVLLGTFKPLIILTTLITVAFSLLIMLGSTQKIGGVTGDILGFVIEISEAIYLLLVILMTNLI